MKKYRISNEIKPLRDMRDDLKMLLEAEANRLYRLARRMEEHGVSAEEVQKCREEANEFHMTGYPERVLDPFRTWRYAFYGCEIQKGR